MNLAQHEKLVALMETLNALQQRMHRVKDMFPNYHAHLLQQYNKLLLEARQSHVLPPWMM
ncbi:MAG: hypothetical protein ACOVOO_03310 [Flavobacteriales bacterium]|jgi:hypothetical protein